MPCDVQKLNQHCTCRYAGTDKARSATTDSRCKLLEGSVGPAYVIRKFLRYNNLFNRELFSKFIFSKFWVKIHVTVEEASTSSCLLEATTLETRQFLLTSSQVKDK